MNKQNVVKMNEWMRMFRLKYQRQFELQKSGHIYVLGQFICL